MRTAKILNNQQPDDLSPERVIRDPPLAARLRSSFSSRAEFMKHSYDVEEADFDDLVVARSHEVPVLLDIGAEWCSPCRVLGPMLEKLSVEYAGKFVLAKVDADENMKIAGRHKVKGFPTVIAYSRGQETDRFHSAQPLHFLRNFIDKLVAQHAAP
jgi:putative thioredoxin